MTPLETVVLATYFFILIVLAGYGWHRYYLVYAYMKHKDRVPVAGGHVRAAADGHRAAADLQRDVRRRTA